MSIFANRVDAGRKLARALKLASKKAIVLAIPRGGVVVGYEIAKVYDIPLDIIITKKIGAPSNPELAIGAVAEDGTFLPDQGIINMLGISKEYITSEVERQKKEIQRRIASYRDRTEMSLENLDVIIVDDGVATGSTLKVALRSIRKKNVRSLTVAVPVGPSDTIHALGKEADRVVCLSTPEPFYAIGQFYEDFEQITDEEVKRLLAQNRKDLKKGDT